MRLRVSRIGTRILSVGVVVTICSFFLAPLTVVADFTLDTTTTEAIGFDANVYTVAQDGDTLYVGGTFTNVGIPAARFGVFGSTGSASTGTIPTSGQVSVLISDGSGGWYIGGQFTTVGGETRNRLAHIESDGSLDANFDPNMNNTVLGLVLTADESTLYVAGQFTSVGGNASYARLVALDTSDGSVITAFNPGITDGIAQAIALSADESTLYVGGSFTNVNSGTTRRRLAAFSTSNGTATSFNPNIATSFSFVREIKLTADESTVYAVGTFTTVGNATTRNRAAAFTIATSATTSFDPNLDSGANTLAFSSDEDTVYIGGQFSTVNGGTSRTALAAFASASGTVTSFDAGITSTTVNDIKLSADDSTLYVGGSFTTVNTSVTRNRMAAFDTSTSTVTSFNPNLNSSVQAIAFGSGGTVVLGGDFVLSNLKARNHLAAISLTDGSLLSFDPDVDNNVEWMVLSSDASTLYIGGPFTDVNNGTTRNRVAALSTSTGTATSFDPNFNGTVNALQLTSDDATLYVGGAFTDVNSGTTRNRVAAVSTSTGMATSFDPDVNLSVETMVLSSDESTLYLGGQFTDVNSGTTRNRAAAVSTSTGTATSFDPNMNGIVYAIELNSDEDTIYLGGSFTTGNGGTSRNRIAAVDTSGTLTSFNPNMNSTVNSLFLTSDDATLYAGGQFTTVDGGATDRLRVAAFDIDTGSVTSFDPGTEGTVYIVTATSAGTTLLVGGGYNIMSTSPAAGLAMFTIPAPATPTPSVSLTPTPAVPVAALPKINPTQPAPTTSNPAPSTFGLHEGDTISAPSSNDPDVYIINEHGFKRLFLNPIIFSFYGHLGGFNNVKDIAPSIRDTFITSGLFRNCETNAQEVYAVEVTGEDTGILHHVNISGADAVAQDASFFQRVFCINSNEFNWYSKGNPYTSLSQVPSYKRE